MELKLEYIGLRAPPGTPIASVQGGGADGESSAATEQQLGRRVVLPVHLRWRASLQVSTHDHEMHAHVRPHAHS